MSFGTFKINKTENTQYKKKLDTFRSQCLNLKNKWKMKKIVSDNHFWNFHQIKTKNRICSFRNDCWIPWARCCCDLPVIDCALKKQEFGALWSTHCTATVALIFTSFFCSNVDYIRKQAFLSLFPCLSTVIIISHSLQILVYKSINSTE